MSRRTVIFDIDGCLADFVWGFTYLAHKFYNTPVTATAQQPHWDGFPGLTEEQIADIWKRVHYSPTFWSDLPPLVMWEVFARINRLDADVYFVTNREGRDVRNQTVAWLRHHDIQHPNVILSSRKGELARAVNATHMIDDKAGNAIYAAYYSPSTRSYLLDRPYNRFSRDVLGSTVTRVQTMEVFLDDVEAGR